MVHITDVQPAQLTDPDAGGVEQFHDRRVAEQQRLVPDAQPAPRWMAWGRDSGQHRGHLVLPGYLGQRAVHPGRTQLRARIAG